MSVFGIFRNWWYLVKQRIKIDVFKCTLKDFDGLFLMRPYRCHCCIWQLQRLCPSDCWHDTSECRCNGGKPKWTLCLPSVHLEYQLCTWSVHLIKKGLQLVKQGCKVPKMQILSVLSDLECFLRSWDAMQGVEVQIRVPEPRMKHLISECALKLPTAPMKCVVGKIGLQLIKEVKTW